MSPSQNPSSSLARWLRAIPGAMLTYPHILLAMFIVWAIIIIRGLHPAAYFALIVLAALVVVSPKLRKFTNFVSKCISPILLGLLFVMIYFQVYQTKVVLGFDIEETFKLHPAEILKLAQFNEEYREPFYTAISTLYAIILALALVKGMEDVDDLRQSIAEETHRVRSIWNYLSYFEDDELNAKSLEAKAQFRTLLVKYLKNIPDGQGQGDPELNREVMNSCRKAVLDIEPFDRDDEIAQKEIMFSLETVGILRAKRLGSNGSKISGYLMSALWLMSLALLLPFLAEPLCFDATTLREKMGPEAFNAYRATNVACAASDLLLSPSRFSQYYMIFIIVSFFSFLMLMLHDLSSHDKGFWRVDHSAFRDLHAELANEVDGLNTQTRNALVNFENGATSSGTETHAERLGRQRLQDFNRPVSGYRVK